MNNYIVSWDRLGEFHEYLNRGVLLVKASDTTEAILEAQKHSQKQTGHASAVKFNAELLA